MTQISTNYTGVAANNGQASGNGTTSVTESSLKGHHGHHHADSASGSSFSSLMDLLGGTTDADQSSSNDPLTSSTADSSDPTDGLASLGASPLTANDISNAPSSDDPSALLQAMRRYAQNSPSSPSANDINQSA